MNKKKCDSSDQEIKIDVEADQEAEKAEKTVKAAEEAKAAAEDNNGDQKPEAEKKELSDAEKLAELSARYLYLQAEYQNYRKRVAKELSDARIMAIENTLTPFLSVYDYLNMAKTAAQKSDNIESLRQGLDMIITQFFKAFEDIGVKPFDACGENFDPSRHDAVSKESSDSVPEGVITKAWNCGFTLGDRLLRPARVVVSSGPQEADQQEKSDEEK